MGSSTESPGPDPNVGLKRFSAGRAQKLETRKKGLTRPHPDDWCGTWILEHTHEISWIHRSFSFSLFLAVLAMGSNLLAKKHYWRFLNTGIYYIYIYIYIYIYVSKGFPRKKTDSEKEAVGKRAGPPNTSHVFLCGMMFKTGSFQIPCWWNWEQLEFVQGN